MRISIFQLKQDEPFKNEYNKMMKILLSKCISFDKKEYTYFDFINHYLFHNWKYRGTYLDCYEYLEFIGVNVTTKKITEEAFLNLKDYDNELTSLFRADDFTNDLIKNLIIIFGNDSFIKSFYRTFGICNNISYNWFLYCTSYFL